MNNIDDLMQVVSVSGVWRDSGSPLTFQINKIDLKEDMEGATYHTFDRNDGTAPFFIVYDNKGNKIERSVFHHITGDKNRYGYKDPSNLMNCVRLGPRANVTTPYEKHWNKKFT